MEENRIRLFDAFMENIISKEMRQWLINEGFFTAPASKSHHGNYEGGLFDHSYEVSLNLITYTREFNIEWEKPRSPWIIGMFHDLCKIDEYSKNKDSLYEYNKNSILDGHGEKSCILILKWIHLTDQEIMCIRYHMGAFEGQQAWNNYTNAIRKWPAVFWTHTADMEASQIKGI